MRVYRYPHLIDGAGRRSCAMAGLGTAEAFAALWRRQRDKHPRPIRIVCEELHCTYNETKHEAECAGRDFPKSHCR